MPMPGQAARSENPALLKAPNRLEPFAATTAAAAAAGAELHADETLDISRS